MAERSPRITIHHGDDKAELKSSTPDSSTPLNPSDLTIEVFPPAPKTGMLVGRTPQGIKITHNPTGIAVVHTHHRSQHKNKQAALERLEGMVSATGWGLP